MFKGGASSLVTFIDGFSRKVWAYLLHSRDEVLCVFRNWLSLVKIDTGCWLRIFRSDDGGEYMSR